jgi:hypothetical protein
MNNKNHNPPSNPQSLYTAVDATQQDSRRKRNAAVGLLMGTICVCGYLGIFWFYTTSRPPFTNPISFASGIILLVLIGIPIAIMAAGLKTAYGHYTKFATAFYKVPDEVDIKPIIQRKLFGLPYDNPSNPSFLVIASDKLDAKNSWAASMGGPAKLIIMDGFAVYLERGGKFSRVVGSGMVFLERYETIREIIDLRPQVKELRKIIDLHTQEVKESTAVDAWTKDGIKLEIQLHVKCQILSAETAELSQGKDSAPEDDKRQHPFYDLAAKAAVETSQVRLNNKTNQLEKYDWVAGVCGNVEGHIREHVYSHTINELLRQEVSSTEVGNPGVHLFSSELRDTLHAKVNKEVQRLGARLIELQIVKVDKADIVSEQWKENWGAEWNNLHTVSAGEAEAYRIRAMEKAHAEAQKDMILAIAGGLEKMDEKHMREPLLLYLSGMLENSLVDPYVRAALPKETLETLEQLREYLTTDDNINDSDFNNLFKE